MLFACAFQGFPPRCFLRHCYFICCDDDDDDDETMTTTMMIIPQARLTKFTSLLVKVNNAIQSGSVGEAGSEVEVDNAWVAFRLLLQDLGHFRQTRAEFEARNKVVQVDDD